MQDERLSIISSQSRLVSGNTPKNYLQKQMFKFNYFNSYEAFSKCADYEANIFVSYLYGSFMMIYSQWVRDGRKIPIENMTRFMTALISQGIYGSDLLKKEL